MFTSRPKRLEGFDYLGLYRYFLTFCTYQRRPLLRTGDREVVRTQIERTARENGFVVVAHCYMPDHAHMLIEGQSEDADGKTFITRAKQYSGFRYRAAFGERLRQRYGFERVLRDEEGHGQCRSLDRGKPCEGGARRDRGRVPFLGIQRVHD